MHNQVLVIYPNDVELKDVMYPYQEVDKYQKEKMTDDRCRFFLAVAEDDIPSLLNQIKEYLEKKINECLEQMQYRCEHTYEETKEKYGNHALKYEFDIYKQYYSKLKAYDKVKDLPHDDPEQIKFILSMAYMATDDWIDIYIKGKGYGTFHNPYELWDYYDYVDRHRFPRGTCFLISKEGTVNNVMPFDKLDVRRTIDNIHEWTRVWEYVIFCEKDPCDSRIYAAKDGRFREKWNEHCVVDSIEDVLERLYDEHNGDYVIAALDFHW